MGYADDIGDGDDGQADGEGEAAKFYLIESGQSDGSQYVPVEIAASGGEFPERIGECLKSPYPLIERYYVFIEEEFPPGPKCSMYLADYSVEIFDHTEGESGNNAIERVVCEWQALSYPGYERGAGAAFVGGPQETARHVRIRFNCVYLNAWRVVLEVCSGSPADF